MQALKFRPIGYTTEHSVKPIKSPGIRMDTGVLFYWEKPVRPTKNLIVSNIQVTYK